MVKEKEVKAYELNLYCDVCGEEMKKTGMKWDRGLDTFHEYLCINCKCRVSIIGNFPKIIYK